MKKKLISLLLVLAMVFSLAGIAAFADDEDTIGDTEQTEKDTDDYEDASEPEDEAGEESGTNTTKTSLLLGAAAVVSEDDEDDTTETGNPIEVTINGLSDGISAEDVSSKNYDLDNIYWVRLYGGYTLELPSSAVPYDQYYWVDENGQVYNEYYFWFTDADETYITVVKDESTPTAVKITTVLPEGVTMSDVCWGSPSNYVLSTSSIWFYLYKGYAVTAAGAELLLAYSGTSYTEYYLYPNAGATEITLTVTKIPSGTLQVTGAANQAAIVDGDGNSLSAGDTVESTETLYVTVNQGYVVTGGTVYKYDSDTGATAYRVSAADILADGVATVNVEQGVVVEYVVDEEYADYYISGRTYAVGETLYDFSPYYGYVADFSGAGVTVMETEYYCNSDTGGVYAYYEYTTASVGTLTVTFREATAADNMPTAIKVEYIDEDGALTFNGYKYVLPGGYLWVETEAGYTAEVTGAAAASLYNNSYSGYWDGYADEDATAVTVKIVPIVEDATLKVVNEDGSSAAGAVYESAVSVSDGDTLTAGVNYLRLENGYEVLSVEGAVWAEAGYSVDADGVIYVQYELVPTGDPAEVTVTVVEKATLVTVNIIRNGVYAYAYIADTYEEINGTGTMTSKNELRISMYGDYTVRVTGGEVVDYYVGSSWSYFYIQPTSDTLTVEVITLEEMAEILGDNADGAQFVDATNDPAQQSGSSNNNGSNGSDKPGSSGAGDKTGGDKSPSTGDESSAALWGALAVLCAASAGAVLTIARKKDM